MSQQYTHTFPKFLEDLPEEYSIVEEREGEFEYKKILPPNTLKEKVGDAVDFKPGVIQKAEEKLKSFVRNYLQEMVYDVQELERQLDRMRSGDEAQKIDAKAEFSWIIHEIKSQSGTLQLPFACRVAANLCIYLYELEQKGIQDDLAFDIMDLHIQTLRVIASRKIKDEGSEMGKLMVDGLDVCIKKHLTQDPRFMKGDAAMYLKRLKNALN